MLRRRRKFAATLASMALGAAPLGLLADDARYNPNCEVCPPGFQMPLPQYGPHGTPPSSVPSQPSPGSMPPAPTRPSTSEPIPDSTPSDSQTPGQAQLSDQPTSPDQPPSQSQQPQMATPTFNPSSGGQTTTAATSPQAAAPNMIGDLFGTGDTQKVIIQPATFLQTPAPVAVNFNSQSELVSFLPFGVSTPTVGANVVFDTVMNTFMGTDHNTGTPISQNVSPSTFVSQDTTAMINGGGGLTEHVGAPPDLLTNPPLPGTFIELDQGTAPYQADVEAFTLATKPGLAAQEAAYLNTNGAGTFSGQVGESVTFDNAVATLQSDNGIVGAVDSADEFYHQQVVTYDPGTLIFQPVDVLYTPPPVIINIPNLGGLPGANVGRQKLTENTSPLPQDRVFVNYSHFAGTPLAPGGIDVNRVTPGFEKSFLNGLMSIEVRAPFASTLSSDYTAGMFGNNKETEFGNMAAWWKTLLWEDQTKSIAAGLGVSLPTANDVFIKDSSGTNLLAVDNESAHFLPYVGGVWLPEPRMFISGICQFDVDTSGNSVRLTDYVLGQPTGRLQDVGRPNDADYVFVDVQFGYWMYQNNYGSGFVKGIAPLVELHYNRAMDDADDVIADVNGTSIIAQSTQKTDLFNGLVGAAVLLKHNASLSLAYTTPIGNNDSQFDGEFRASFNWYFGGPHDGGTTNFRGLALTR